MKTRGRITGGPFCKHCTRSNAPMDKTNKSLPSVNSLLRCNSLGCRDLFHRASLFQGWGLPGNPLRFSETGWFLVRAYEINGGNVEANSEYSPGVVTSQSAHMVLWTNSSSNEIRSGFALPSLGNLQSQQKKRTGHIWVNKAAPGEKKVGKDS